MHFGDSSHIGLSKQRKGFHIGSRWYAKIYWLRHGSHFCLAKWDTAAKLKRCQYAKIMDLRCDAKQRNGYHEPRCLAAISISGEQSIISGLQFYRCNDTKIFLSISVNSIAADLISFCFQEDVNVFSFVNIIREDKVKQEDNAGAILACRWEDLKVRWKDLMANFKRSSNKYLINQRRHNISTETVPGQNFNERPFIGYSFVEPIMLLVY